MTREEAIKQLKAKHNGCPLMEGRTKGNWEEIAGSTVTIRQFYPMGNEDGKYYCVAVDEYPDKYFYTGSALTEDIDEYGEFVIGITYEVGQKVKTKGGRTYQPFTII